MEKGIRIQKVLSEQGIASRRKAEEWIEQGKIKINGRPAALGQKINPSRDVVTIDGERVYFQKSSQKYYIMLNKPRGFVTTMNDELGRRCVAELVEDVPERVYPIGRLDKDSEGLLLFTNDGEFANLIMHPSHHVSKTYRVTVRPEISDAQVVRLSTGVEIDGKKTSPAHVTVLEKQPGRVVLQVVIYEGRNPTGQKDVRGGRAGGSQTQTHRSRTAEIGNAGSRKMERTASGRNRDAAQRHQSFLRCAGGAG